jgi:hypothetical protein
LAAVPTVSLPQKGGCLCGAVRYALNAGPLLAYACHCHRCQTRSGAAFTLTLVVRTVDLSVAGTPRVDGGATASGRIIEESSCGECRTRVFSRAPIAPEYMSLRAGTLDDVSWVAPIAQSFVECAIPWAVIPGVRAVAWSEFDYVALGREYVASAPRFEALAS